MTVEKNKIIKLVLYVDSCLPISFNAWLLGVLKRTCLKNKTPTFLSTQLFSSYMTVEALKYLRWGKSYLGMPRFWIT